MSVFKLLRTIILTGSLLLLSGAVVSAAPGPRIIHDPLVQTFAGHRMVLTAEIADTDSNIDMARIYFKASNEDRYYFVTMHKVDHDIYTGILPTSLPGTESIKYFIVAKNGNDEIAKSQRYLVSLRDNNKKLARVR